VNTLVLVDTSEVNFTGKVSRRTLTNAVTTFGCASKMRRAGIARFENECLASNLGPQASRTCGLGSEVSGSRVFGIRPEV
jgi:hypothetical protein